MFTKTIEMREMARNVMGEIQHQRKLILAFAVGLLGGTYWLRSLKTAAPLMVVGLMVSTIPAYLFVPATHIMYDYAPYFYMGFLGIASTAGALTSAAAQRVLKRYSA